MLARLVCLAAFLLSVQAAEAQRFPAVYVEGLGATSGYSIGLEQVLIRSADNERRLSFRAGAGYWVDKVTVTPGLSESVLRAPVSALASFALGEPLGVPARFEAGGGVLISYEVADLTPLGRPELTENVNLEATPFMELAVRANPARRFSVRGGVVLRGEPRSSLDAGLTPLLSVGYGL